MLKVLYLSGGEPGQIAGQILDKLAAEGLIEIVRLQDENTEYDILLSVSFPSRISQFLCKRAHLGAINLHTGLLPRHRGSNPLNWALIWGDPDIGVTLHKIVDSFDAGDVVLQKSVPIEWNDFVWDLRKKCFELFEPALRELFANPAELIKNAWQQDQACMTYAQKRRPEDSQLNLNAPAHHIYNLFRACDPREYPAFVMIDGKKHIVTNVTPDGQVTYLKEQADISVIVPCWNYGMFLTECLDSILAQTVLPREIIIADDCSTDKSPEIMEEYRKTYPFLIRVMRTPNRLGTVPNENAAAKTVSTKYFFFLDADDKLDPHYIEKCMAKATDEKVAIIYSDMAKFGNWDGEWRVQDWDPTALRQGNYINGHSVILKLAFDEAGGLKDGPGFEDHQLWVDIMDLNKGYYGVHIPELLIWYRRHDYGHRTDRSDINKRSSL